MTMTRRALRELLQGASAAPTPAPDAAFVDALERRLRAGEPRRVTSVVPFRRRTRPVLVAAVAATVVLTGTVAAAAGPWHHRDDRVRSVVPAAEPTTTTATTAGPATTTSSTSGPTSSTRPIIGFGSAPTPITSPVDSSATIAATTIAVEPTSTAPGPATTAARPRSTTTTATTRPPEIATTAPATTAATTVPSSTTEVAAPAALSLSCNVVTANSVRCEWSKSSDPAVVGYRLLRGLPSGGPGRVFSTGPGDAGYTDITAASATDYSYVVHAVRADGTSVAHSPLVDVHCCEAPTTTTSTTRV